MWKKNLNNVNKVLKEGYPKTFSNIPLQHIGTYTQIDQIIKNKIRLNNNFKSVVHIFTPLIVVINFYI